MSKDRAADLHSWLRSNSVDCIADYLARGRRFASLRDEELCEAWKVAFRAWAAQPSFEPVQADHGDLFAEIGFRGLEPPVEDAGIKEAFKTFAARTKNMTPEDDERVADELARRLTAYKIKRDRGA